MFVSSQFTQWTNANLLVSFNVPSSAMIFFFFKRDRISTNQFIVLLNSVDKMAELVYFYLWMANYHNRLPSLPEKRSFRHDMPLWLTVISALFFSWRFLIIFFLFLVSNDVCIILIEIIFSSIFTNGMNDFCFCPPHLICWSQTRHHELFLLKYRSACFLLKTVFYCPEILDILSKPVLSTGWISHSMCGDYQTIRI